MLAQKAAPIDSSGRGQESSPSATPSRAGFWQRLASRVSSWFEIPYGYEDESGFHYGQEPVPSPFAAQSNSTPKVFTDRACDAMLSPAPVGSRTAETPATERNLMV